MQRSTSFGVGLTLVLMGCAVFHWIHSMDPGDNAHGAMLIGCVPILSRSILVGQAVWPPNNAN